MSAVEEFKCAVEVHRWRWLTQDSSVNDMRLVCRICGKRTNAPNVDGKTWTESELAERGVDESG